MTITATEPHLPDTDGEEGRCSICGETATTSEVHHPPGATLHLGGNVWAHPDLAPLLHDADSVWEHPENARRGDIPAIRESVRTSGIFRPIYVQRSTRHILGGNHTHRSQVAEGARKVPMVFLDVDDQQARRILLADNRTAELGSYDDTALLTLLNTIQESELSYTGTGYDDASVADLAAAIAAADDDLGNDDDDDNRAPTTGEQLSIADVTWGDPHHKVHHGEVWTLGRHTLVIAKLHTEHHLWRNLLTDERVFAPYPEPYLTTSEVAQERPLLLIQPNVYLAGHLLDKHASVFPDDTVEKRA